MIIEWAMILGEHILDVLLSILGVLPNFSQDVIKVVDDVFAFMFSGVALMSIFVDFRMVKILIPFAIAIMNFDNIFKLIMFILRKIPFVGIE